MATTNSLSEPEFCARCGTLLDSFSQGIHSRKDGSPLMARCCPERLKATTKDTEAVRHDIAYQQHDGSWDISTD